MCFLARPAYGNAVHAQSGLADAPRNPLPILAAVSNTGIEFHVTADHAHAMQIVGPIADEHFAFDGGAELAILDAVGLRHLEDVLARGDVNLPAAEAHGVNPIFDRGDDLVR